MATDTLGAVARTITTFVALATKTPKFRMTAAFSDGQKLYAVRYASDDRAPTLYHRWSASQQVRSFNVITRTYQLPSYNILKATIKRQFLC